MNYLPVIGYRKHRKEIISTIEIANFFGFNRKRWVAERTFSWLKRKCRRLLMRWERIANLYVVGVFSWIGS